MTKFRLAPLGLLATLAFGGSSRALELDVQGHRGCRGPEPEGTLAAFRFALDAGATTLEMDVQATRDRALVVHHDPALDAGRCTDDSGARPRSATILELDLDEIRRLRCDGEPLASLDDVLALARSASRPVRVNIEIKQQDARRCLNADALALLVVDAVRRHGVVERTLVESFDPDALRAVRALEPRLRTGIIVRDRGEYDRRLAESGADVLLPRRDDLRREDVERLSSRGIDVIPWVVNDVDDARALLEWGVRGIVTDRPDRLVPALARDHPQPSPSLGEPVMRPATVATLALATLASVAQPTAAQEPVAPPALRLSDVRSVAVYPFTSGGNVDTFCTSLWVERARELKELRRVMDPFELGVTADDGKPFHAQSQLPQLLAEARAKGADAIVVGAGKWYDWGFRIEVRLIEVNRGEVVWSAAKASGFHISGPSAKRDVVTDTLWLLRKALR